MIEVFVYLALFILTCFAIWIILGGISVLTVVGIFGGNEAFFAWILVGIGVFLLVRVFYYLYLIFF